LGEGGMHTVSVGLIGSMHRMLKEFEGFGNS
jgi:hypothetical protein